MAVFTWIGWIGCLVALLCLSVLVFGGLIGTLIDWTRDRRVWPWIAVLALFCVGAAWLWHLMFANAPWVG